MEKIVEALNRLTEAVEKQTKCLSAMHENQKEFFADMSGNGIDVNIDTSDISNAIESLGNVSAKAYAQKKYKTQK